MGNNKFIYFKNFTSLRGIAALSVVFSHLMQMINSKFLIENGLYQIGGISVTFFFVLSGFLISYLLLVEKEKFNTINLRKFYFRRILRIWPLYFLAIIIGLVLFFKEVKAIFIYLICFLPTIPFVLKNIPSQMDTMWSIGVEEQFYIFFPLFFLLIKTKRIQYVLLLLLLSYYILKFSVSFLTKTHEIHHLYMDLLYYERFDSMILGALGAYVYLFKDKSKRFKIGLRIIYNKIFQIILYSIFFTYLFSIFIYNIKTIHPIFSLLFVLILINLGTNSQSIFNIENSTLNFLGGISYSLYLSHKFILQEVFIFFNKFNLSMIEFSIYFTLITICFSIFLAYILHRYIEIPFLKIKEKFSMK